MNQSYKLLTAIGQKSQTSFEIHIFYQGKTRIVKMESVSQDSGFAMFRVELAEVAPFHLTIDTEKDSWISLEFKPAPSPLLFILGNEIENYYLGSETI